ncbi:glycosyltransferase family 4 protein [Pontibacter sp. E15-1]|uniref:glycosyltransferase family 4 protein n=1 Tax=Pontibacter sp. E15-1 TaxID=2919918 RepID=UPI001F50006D|nr:glycosyltransferase family 4 protein [Pontibacter sp. E15-1]MCJ8166340.1 glycosyltransferase family 4 protein [Pontibacter sp. E15-1]
MRIALLTDGIYPYVLGGMQKHSYYLAKYLARNGVHVDLYHTGNEEAATPQLKEFTEEELAFIEPYYIPFPSVAKLPGHYVLESFLYSAHIYKKLKENEPVDFIYAQGFAAWKTISEQKKGAALPPIGVNFHGVEMFQQAPSFNVKLQHLLLRAPVQFILKDTDYVFSLGGKLTAIQKALTSKKILEIPIGIESHWLEQSNKAVTHSVRKFVFIGRYERRKGIEELQEVIESLSGKYAFHFSFIGPIPTEKQLKYDEVDYLGLIKNEKEIKLILQACDVLICPSYSEGMPTVILEAMASGLAVIATNVGAVSKIVTVDNGWLIPVADKQALKQAIVDAIHLDEKELHQKKEASLQLVKDSYTWEAIIKTTIKEIKTIVTKTGTY